MENAIYSWFTYVSLPKGTVLDTVPGASPSGCYSLRYKTLTSSAHCNDLGAKS